MITGESAQMTGMATIMAIGTIQRRFVRAPQTTNNAAKGIRSHNGGTSDSNR